jgi:hypothetical protein
MGLLEMNGRFTLTSPDGPQTKEVTPMPKIHALATTVALSMIVVAGCGSGHCDSAAARAPAPAAAPAAPAAPAAAPTAPALVAPPASK